MDGMKRILFFVVPLLLLLTSCQQEQEPDSLIYKVKSAELATVEYTVRQIIRNSDETWSILGDRKVLFSCKATLKAGIDLQRLTDEDIQASGSTVRLTLPHAQILAINIQPDDIKVAYSKVSVLRSDYSQQEYDAILQAGEYAIKGDLSLRQSIIADAEQNARDFFEIMLRSLGYEHVEITFK